MLIIKKGNILEAEENLICHQVNCLGSFGGGLALQIANKYPFVAKECKKRCYLWKYNYDELKKDYFKVRINNNQ